jgi:hypothetical protein
MIRNRKGTHIVIEQVFLALMGIVIIVLVFSVFQGLRENTGDFVAEQQFESVATYVHNAVIKAYETGRYSDFVKIRMELPAEIAEHPYTINLSNSNITVEALDDATLTQSLQIYNINANLNGKAYSEWSRYYLFYNTTANQMTFVQG